MAAETELSRLVVRLVGDSTQYKRMIDNVQKTTQEAGRTMQRESEKVVVFGKTIDELGTSVSRFAGQMIAFRAVQQPFEALKGAVKAAGDMEQLEIAFETIIGDAGRAQLAIKSLVEFSDKTPFEMPEVVAAAKQMLAMGTTAENIVPTMTMLGDVAAGLGIRLGDLTYIFGTLQSQGRAFTQDINQFAMRGIPIWDELGKIFGKTKMEMRTLVEEGKVGFAEVEQAFKNMTGEGGRFHDLMEKQSQSFNGMLSTLSDAMGGVARTIGKNVIEMFYLKEIVGGLTDLFKRMEAAISGTSPVMKVVITYTVALTTASLALFLVWKVGSLAVGLVIGVLKDMVVTMRAVIAATWAWVTALGSQTVTVFAAAKGQAGLNGVMTMTTKTNWSAVAAATALKAALIGVVIWGGIELGRALTSSSADMAYFNREMERAVKISEEWANLRKKRREKFEIELGGTEGEARVSALQNRVKELNALIRNAATSTAHFTKEWGAAKVEDIRDPFNIFGTAERLKVAEQALNDAKAALEDYSAELKDVEEKLKKASEPTKYDTELLTDLAKFNTQLSLQARTLRMTSDEAQLYKFQMAGLPPAMLAATQSLIEMKKAAEAEKKAAEDAAKAEEKRVEDIQDIIEKLQEERDTMGMDEYAVKLNTLAKLDATGVYVGMADALVKTIREQKKHEDLMKEGAKITEQFRTPTQVLIDQWNTLDNLLNAGAIDWDTYNRAIEDAEEKFTKATEAVEKMKEEVTSLDAVLAGGAEAKARIAAFAERNAVPSTAGGGGVAGGLSSGTAVDMTRLLAQIVLNTGITAAKPAVELAAADVDEAA